jgi:hypothetical protein
MLRNFPWNKVVGSWRLLHPSLMQRGLVLGFGRILGTDNIVSACNWPLQPSVIFCRLYSAIPLLLHTSSWGVCLVKHGLVVYVWAVRSYGGFMLVILGTSRRNLNWLNCWANDRTSFRKLVGFEKLASFWVSWELWVRRKLNVTFCNSVLSWVLGSVVSILKLSPRFCRFVAEI